MFCVIYLQSDAKLLEIFSQSLYSTLYIYKYSCQNHNHLPESVKKWTRFVSLPPKSEGSLIKACLSVKGEGGNSSSSVEKKSEIIGGGPDESRVRLKCQCGAEKVPDFSLSVSSLPSRSQSLMGSGGRK